MSDETNHGYISLKAENGTFWRRNPKYKGSTIALDEICPFCGDQLKKCKHKNIELTPVKTNEVPICPGCKNPGYGHYSPNKDGVFVCNACSIDEILGGRKALDE
jgi:ribosomal protein L37AE/L43A